MPVKVFEKSGGLEKWYRLFSQLSHCVWLDGVDGASGADWSILAADPVEWRSGPKEDLLGWMDEWEERLRKLDPGSAIFAGGLIGQLDYAEEMPAYPSDRIPSLAGWMGLYNRALVEHRPTGIIYAAMGDWVEGASAELDKWMDSIRSQPEPERVAMPVASSQPTPNQSRSGYMEKVRRIREWIASGDIYQANLSQRFRCQLEGSAVDLYQRLRRHNPAPYSAFLDCGDRLILSSSPESFLQVDSSRVVSTRPIKGTRPRSEEPEKDRDLAAALRTNEKERAELLMIVDMERNDLGKVCEVGSVKASREFALESFASVHHLVGDVEGRLRPEVKISDLFLATFPGGSITGAPKKRAMEIIRELEPEKRGAYCGVIGFLSAGGVSRWNIAIRTMEISGSTVEFGVGAGIVWDSDPQMEFEETLHKARRMFSALGWNLDDESLYE